MISIIYHDRNLHKDFIINKDFNLVCTLSVSQDCFKNGLGPIGNRPLPGAMWANAYGPTELIFIFCHISGPGD